jgi:poly(3-hydroxybutyrate) depolymerase
MELPVPAESNAFGPSPAWDRERTVAQRPFAGLIRLERQTQTGPVVLVVCPLSGHRPRLFFDLVVGLASDHDVHVLAWEDAKDVPVGAGRFGLDENIGYVMDSLRQLGRGVHAVALSQSALPVLAATALLSARDNLAAPETLTLLGGKIDTRINPARIDRLARLHSLTWLAANAIRPVPASHRGCGRQVYSTEAQRSALAGYFGRQISRGGELFRKMVHDDGLDPAGHPFGPAFFDVTDLPAEWFLETISLVYQTSALPTGTLSCRGERIDLSLIRSTALLTIEGELDDIAPVGQTRVAQALCSGIPSDRKSHYVQARSGHFGLFHGLIWREHVLPRILDFIRTFRRIPAIRPATQPAGANSASNSSACIHSAAANVRRPYHRP